MKQHISLTVNAWVVCAVLLLTNLVTLFVWQPWSGNSDRTVTVTGTSTIEAEPDQFVFSPYYQKEGEDKAKVDAEITTLSNSLVAKLKELGVEDSAIKTSVNTYDRSDYYPLASGKNTSSLSLTITLKDKALTQKVQDYIATTAPLGSVTPYPSFSTAKQKSLESSAREKALKDATEKAASSAKQVNAGLGKVIKVSDSNTNGTYPMPWISSAEPAKDMTEGSSRSMVVQPGLNEFTFTVEVTYKLK